MTNELLATVAILQDKLDKFKWLPIEEYDKGEYDWVLIKYFDKDYECVPDVAEKRFGKWYLSDGNELNNIFEVKYFFDMQQLDYKDGGKNEL